jgi:ATP-dependent Lhr-like helicase
LKSEPAVNWFASKGWKPQKFQIETWKAYQINFQGIVNAPTGSGKTFSLAVPPLLKALETNQISTPNLKVIWITPIRALAKEIASSFEMAIEGLKLNWTVGIRTGDTNTAERAKQKKQMPNILITTPESLHVMLATKNFSEKFKFLELFVADEWHELLGSKRAVQVELALSRLRSISPELKTWGISATIGNLELALDVLLGVNHPTKTILIRANLKKKIEVISVLPDEIEKYPWAGHLGLKLLEKALPIIDNSESTLIFTNTRGQAEIWYQRLLEVAPELSGILAMHHGSISKDLRNWVEEALHESRLKAVVCTSSLDLGVDFRPVETIIQVGSPKGVARFMQRAGRSGHQPGAISKIYFLPTNALELLEGAALREAINNQIIEDRVPFIRSFDVLIQYLVTLAVADGFDQKETFNQIKNTISFSSISKDEWNWLLRFITSGGDSLKAYDEYNRVEVIDGLFKVVDRRIARRHRLSIGSIVSDMIMKIKYSSGGFIGTVEEYFISILKIGDIFWFSGRCLELVRIKDQVVEVKNAPPQKGKIPSWQGGRMPLSSQMSEVLRKKLTEASENNSQDIELKTIFPILTTQAKTSLIPNENEFLIEKFNTEEGCHVYLYPFEGRAVHEGMASIISYRIALLKPMSFSLAFNDYGIELLSDQDIPIEDAIDSEIFSPQHLRDDIVASVNASEMARRRFRDIAAISGLIFKGFPHAEKKERHLQASSSLLFNVFTDYDKNNLLYRQAFEEVMEFQLEEGRMRNAFSRIINQEVKLVYPKNYTPFSFPLMVDRLREKLSTEKIEDKIKKMKLVLD